MIENPAFKFQSFGSATLEAAVISARTAELACEASAGLTCTVFSTLTKNILWLIFFGAKVA